MTVHQTIVPPQLRHWHANLQRKMRGEPLEGIHDGKPQQGYYRTKQGDRWVAAFIERDKNDPDGRLICRVGDEMRDPVAIWLHLADEPITRETCLHFFSTGRWPGVEAKPANEEGEGAEPPAHGVQTSPPPIGHNNPPEDAVTAIRESMARAKEWREKQRKITDEITLKIATNKVGTLREHIATAKKLHKKLKEPITEAGRALDKQLLHPAQEAEEEVRLLLSMITAHAAELDRIANEARLKAEAEHAKKVAAAEKKDKAPPPPPPEQPAVPPKTLHSDTGRALSLKEEAKLVPSLEKKWLGTLLAHLFRDEVNQIEIIEVAMKLARADWKATGVPPPGTKIEVVKKVA